MGSFESEQLCCLPAGWWGAAASVGAKVAVRQHQRHRGGNQQEFGSTAGVCIPLFVVTA